MFGTVAGVLVATMALLAACSAHWNDPLPVTPVPGNPCGETGVMCAGHMCCAEGEVCGGSPGCPAGACCFEGEENVMAIRHPQRAQ